MAKAKLTLGEQPAEVQAIPSLKQWFQVVGISQPAVEVLCEKFKSLEFLCELTDHEIRKSFIECGVHEDECRWLIKALQNIRKYTGMMVLKEASVHL